ncbi:MAG: hypothetical protein A3F42_00510 [Gammaproteobacteria bacterium RIFCSPHIGHO2_12_FULL_37_34]|nr:MAG: hypothetical protein A3F42_00510 [Gammaproteobacteria bacterium RIFCSPHIGHO2_12_FULL_37_34]
MIHETPSTTTLPLGARLKLARETLGLESKDAASQLRLNEKYIQMMEKEDYPDDLPATFIRGYLRSYGRLLQIPTQEIEQAIEEFKPALSNYPPTTAPTIKSYTPITNDNHLMRFFTYMIALTFIGLVGAWWYTHSVPTIQLVGASTKTIPEPKPALAQTTLSGNNIERKITIPIAGSKTQPTSDDSEEDDDTEASE